MKGNKLRRIRQKDKANSEWNAQEKNRLNALVIERNEAAIREHLEASHE